MQAVSTPSGLNRTLQPRRDESETPHVLALESGEGAGILSEAGVTVMRKASLSAGKSSSRLSGRAGFTLVEALAAFAIVAALSVLLQRGLVQSRASLVAIEDRKRAEGLALSLLAEPVGADETMAGGRSGSADGLRFQTRLSPLILPGIPDPAPASTGGGLQGQAQLSGAAMQSTPPKGRWVPFREQISVQTQRGAVIAVETIKLFPVE
jgi:type II secretory pathway pseudopilin PulG